METEPQGTQGIEDALFVHSFLLHVFIKHLLHARYLLEAGSIAANQRDETLHPQSGGTNIEVSQLICLLMLCAVEENEGWGLG